MPPARPAFARRLVRAHAAGSLGLGPALLLTACAPNGRTPFELLALCPGEPWCAILYPASSVSLWGRHPPGLARGCTRGSSLLSEGVLTSGVDRVINSLAVQE